MDMNRYQELLDQHNPPARQVKSAAAPKPTVKASSVTRKPIGMDMSAFSLGFHERLQKQAGLGTEYASRFNPLNLCGGGLLGMGAAGLTDTRTAEEQAAAEGDTWSNLLIPGVGAYNEMKRLERSRAEFEENNPGEESNMLHQLLGAGLNPFILGGLGAAGGAGLGALAGNPGAGAAIGGGLGVGIGSLGLLGGAFGAAATPTRTDEEQERSERESALEQYLVPGLGNFNTWKRLGHSAK